MTLEKLRKFGPMLAHSFLVYDDLVQIDISTHTLETIVPCAAKDGEHVPLFRQVSFAQLIEGESNHSKAQNIFSDAKAGVKPLTPSGPSFGTLTKFFNNQIASPPATFPLSLAPLPAHPPTNPGHASLPSNSSRRVSNPEAGVNNSVKSPKANTNAISTDYTSPPSNSTRSQIEKPDSDICRPPTRSSSPIVPERKHALLWVGIREDETGKQFYLFQNWWKEKQFFEADIHYLEKCEVMLHYVVDELKDFVETKMLYGKYFETNCDFSNQNVSEIYMPYSKNKS
jgi:hypothetical protein